MKSLRLVTLISVALVSLAACGGSGAVWTYAPSSAGPSVAGAATPAPTVTPPAAVEPIVVTLMDTMRIEPASMTVPAGQPVTFIVTNAGSITHEFTLGDADIQDEHEQEMIEMGGMGMTHDEPNAISVPAGATKSLTFTFTEAGTSLAGCHVPGHYPAGMKATITVI